MGTKNAMELNCITINKLSPSPPELNPIKLNLKNPPKISALNNCPKTC